MSGLGDEQIETLRPRRYDQCDGTCTVDCGHCKGNGRPAARRPRSRPEEVTILRLLYALERWGHKFTEVERDEISHVIFALEQIQDGAR